MESPPSDLLTSGISLQENCNSLRSPCDYCGRGSRGMSAATGHVTHGRKQQILPAEVAELRYYVLNVIHVMIRNPQKWDSRQALHEWIDDLRLS